MNSITQLIQNIKTANWSGANQMFADIMQQKVADRLAVERRTIFTEAASQPPAVLVTRANAGDTDAQYALGNMYLKEQGVVKNDAQTVAWTRTAAEQGNAIAQSTLGNMYANGQGVVQNDTQAVAWWRKAADQGLAGAQYNLGVMYANGRGVAKNAAQAAAWYRKAANKGVHAVRPAR